MDQSPLVPAEVPDFIGGGGSSSNTRNVSMVNGYIVYTRANRGNRNLCNEISNTNESTKFRIREDVEPNAKLPMKENNGKKILAGKENECSEPKLKLSVSMVRPFKRFTRRSAALEGKVVSNDDGGEVSGISRNKLEMKMSKKIVVNKTPMTVKELFHTGLLDGVSVVYMGGIKKASGLRGVIRNLGILCSCSLCNERRIIPPSKFEVHACGQYRRAAEYICLENGKSLLDLLRTCRGVPLYDLEATVQNFLGSPHEEKHFTCKRCKGPPDQCLSPIHPMLLSCLLLQKIKEKGRKEQSWSSKWANKSKSSKSASIPILPKMTTSWKMRKKKLSGNSKILEVTSNAKYLSPQNKSKWKITKKDQRLHKLVFEENGLPDGTEVGYYARGKRLLEGFKMGSGIVCRCCDSEVSPSQFEAHAGCASRKKPYAYIYTSNGVSLHELAISLSKDRKYLATDDDLCIVCWDGGNLLLCDGCPRAFHKECASLSSIPRGDWYCEFCQNMFQREKFVAYNSNAVAAGRVEGVDPIQEITNRCIRIVKDVEADLGACALCRGVDFSRSGFGPRTIILCDQCEKEYHVGCLREHKMAYLKELPVGKWLCCNDCTRIHSTLENLLAMGAERLPESLLGIIKKKQEEKGLEPLNDIDIRWKLLNGKIASRETRPLLLEAVSIFHECFSPIVDAISGRDFIPAMVYGRNVRGQEFGGMYCAVLTVNSYVVSVGMLRIFGKDIAELPLVATTNKDHGKGYFQTLFSCIERLLSFLNVKNLVLPAAEEAESIWTDKFGFSKMIPDQLISYRKNCHQMVTFKGTNMLHKTVPPCRIIHNQSWQSDI
ncbi:increased DNA methylation 1 isoform X2 [Arachis ipaensis]|uniref:increased DNA methylation 1 isoform X2 n=1 Tax=Arachis ipaensis TaxID=130454 RepID=UPI000A2B11A4|nr:increased DNA methylation 1 isoform X2 [Arachis ipaensis]